MGACRLSDGVYSGGHVVWQISQALWIELYSEFLCDAESVRRIGSKEMA